MATARVFRLGNSQAVRLPNDFLVQQPGSGNLPPSEEVVLRETARGMERAFELLVDLPEDFMAGGRHDGPPEARGRGVIGAVIR